MVTLIASVASVILVLAGVAIYYTVRSNERPPQLTATERARGVQRLTYPDAAKHVPSRPVMLRHRSESVALFFDGATEVGGKSAARIRLLVAPIGNDGVGLPVSRGTLSVGQSLRQDDVTIKVVAVWAMFNYAHDAADVLIAYS